MEEALLSFAREREGERERERFSDSLLLGKEAEGERERACVYTVFGCFLRGAQRQMTAVFARHRLSHAPGSGRLAAQPS